MRVLIVDDHAATLASIASLLKSEFPHIQEIATAGNGLEACRIARELQPGLVILDINLGDACGLDLIPAFARPDRPAIIVLSSADDSQTRSRALAAGATAFVSKLSPAKALIDAIHAILQPAHVIGHLSHPTGTLLPGK